MDDGKNHYKEESDRADQSEDEELSMLSEDGEDEMSEEVEEVIKEERGDLFDKYTVDAFHVRREATLLALVKRAFHQRVIVFFNEKKQCQRAHILFAIFGLKSAEVHGNMSQTERMAAIEKFQRGEIDYLLATDLVARGLDINGVKTVLNFSFPTEPKRYLHRIGRTARAGSSGVAVTMCNDEERKDLKKLSRKLNQNLHVYVMQNKIVKEMHEFLQNTIDPILHTIEVELQQDRELENAYKEAQRAENMIKYKADIMSRPRAEWHNSRKDKLTLQRESRKDLTHIKENFEKNLEHNKGKNKKEREKKREVKAKEKEKELINKGGSKFAADAETDR
jgi:ATP-dependent RNA helicase DDX27